MHEPAMGCDASHLKWIHNFSLQIKTVYIYLIKVKVEYSECLQKNSSR